MVSSDWNYDTVVSRFVTARLSSLAKTDDTIPGFSLPFDREFVSEHKLFEPIPHHRVSQILFLFGRHNEMWVRVRSSGRSPCRVVPVCAPSADDQGPRAGSSRLGQAWGKEERSGTSGAPHPFPGGVRTLGKSQRSRILRI